MHRLVRPLALAPIAVGLAATSPASAASCVGEQSTVYVCVTAPTVEVGSRQLCVYAGGDTCKTVDVPTAGVSGQLDVDCYGAIDCRLASIDYICSMFSFGCPVIG